jgi:hypothetical protein
MRAELFAMQDLYPVIASNDRAPASAKVIGALTRRKYIHRPNQDSEPFNAGKPAGTQEPI